MNDKRTEYVAVWVTPEVKKEFTVRGTNEKLQEDIIRYFLTSERDWLEYELRQIDEATIKYSAKLIGIRDAFEKTQSAHVEEVEKIYSSAKDTFKKLDEVAVSTRKSIDHCKENLNDVLKAISNIDFYKVERLLELVNKFNNMSEVERGLIKKLLA